MFFIQLGQENNGLGWSIPFNVRQTKIDITIEPSDLNYQYLGEFKKILGLTGERINMEIPHTDLDHS